MSISARKINAIFQMKFKMILKNISIMTAPIMAILFVIIFKLVMPDMKAPMMTTNTFLLSFGLMFNIVMGGIMMGSYPIAEEKEKNTLRVLLTSSVNGAEYLIGTMIPSLIIITVVNFALIPLSGTPFSKVNLLEFIFITLVSTIISILIGYIIGIYSKNQMQSGLLGMPIMLILIMLPDFSIFNKHMLEISSYFYSGSLNKFINAISAPTMNQWGLKDTVVMVVWLVISTLLFLYTYQKHGLD